MDLEKNMRISKLGLDEEEIPFINNLPILANTPCKIAEKEEK